MSAAATMTPPDAGTETTTFDQDLASAIEGAVESVPLETEQPTTTTESTPSTEAAAPAPAAEAATPSPAPATDGVAYKLTEDGSSYLVPKAELGTLTGVKQFADAVQNRFPTVNDAESAYFAASDFRAIQSDFLNGDVDHVLNFFAGKDHSDTASSAQYAQSFARMAERMPEVLKGVNEPAYSKMGDGFVQSRIDAAYQRAAETGDPQDLQMAQYLDWGATGKYKTEVPKHDPVKAEADRQAAEAQARSTAVEQRESALMDRDWKSFNQGSLDGPKWTQFNAAIDKALEPVKAKYDPMVFEAVKKNIGDQIIQKLQGDFEWARTHGNELKSLQSAYQQLWKGQKPTDGLKPRIQAYHNDFMARVQRQLPAIAKPLLEKATASAVAQPKPAPPARPQTPSERAPNGQFQAQKQGREFYNVLDDPEFQNSFKVPAR